MSRGKRLKHVFGQTMPRGLLVTDPLPVIATSTARVIGPGLGPIERPDDANASAAATAASTSTMRPPVIGTPNNTGAAGPRFYLWVFDLTLGLVFVLPLLCVFAFVVARTMMLWPAVTSFVLCVLRSWTATIPRRTVTSVWSP